MALSLVGLCAMSAAAESARLPQEIETWLTQYASTHPTYRGMPAGPPQPENILLAYGDLNGDHREDAVLIFPMEVGGSGWVQYAAVFAREGEHFTFCCITKVGEKGATLVESVSVANDRVILSGQRFVPGVDAMCCPSRLWRRTLRVTKANHLVQAKNGDQ